MCIYNVYIWAPRNHTNTVAVASHTARLVLVPKHDQFGNPYTYDTIHLQNHNKLSRAKLKEIRRPYYTEVSIESTLSKTKQILPTDVPPCDNQ